MKSIVIFFLLTFTADLQAQVEFDFKLESAYSFYLIHLVDYDAEGDFSYYLKNRDGVGLNGIGGIRIIEQLFIGVGLGYQNFEGHSGVILFGDLEYLPLKGKLTPLANLKVGHSHLWNDHPSGTSTAFGEFCLGLNYGFKSNISIYIKSGVQALQESWLVPVYLGARF